MQYARQAVNRRVDDIGALTTWRVDDAAEFKSE